jgi:amidophosphoribosyltransferase
MSFKEHIFPHRVKVEDKPREYCGVAGAINFDTKSAFRDVRDILECIQQRGYDAVGIVTVDLNKIFHVEKKPGLVEDAFPFNDPDTGEGLTGDVAVGHVRYATSGSKEDVASKAQPLVITHAGRSLAIAHNGNIPEQILQGIKDSLPPNLHYETGIDSEIIGWKVILSPGNTWKEKVMNALKDIPGSYSLVLATDEGELIAARDPLSIKPLYVGHVKNGLLVASETVGFQFIGNERWAKDEGKWEEVNGGEIVVVGKDGKIEKDRFAYSKHSAKCLMEYIYFQHQLSANNTEIRRKMGENLASQEKAPFGDSAVVCGIAESGLLAAEGFSQATGIINDRFLVSKNRHFRARTFIQPTQLLREQMTKRKFFISEDVKGKEIILVDDSLVRSTTMKALVKKLKDMGASKVHVRISSPKIIDICDLGMDIPNKDDLAALEKMSDGTYRIRTDEEIAESIGATSLSYLSLEGLIDAVGIPREDLCTHCFTSEHPIFDRVDIDKEN